MSIDITSAQDIAGHIYQEVEAAEYPRLNMDGSWQVISGDLMVAITGDDGHQSPEDMGFVMWSLWSEDDDEFGRDQLQYGCWANSDRADTEAQIAQIIGLMQ